jgi:periplasmic mercuric ion binding protein
MNKVFILILSFGISFNMFAQKEIKTENIMVKGNCGMCKKRIESALIIKGVTNTYWNIDTKILTVSYLPTKTNIETIKRRIAKAGHDADTIKSNDITYNKLHTCCQYERN